MFGNTGMSRTDGRTRAGFTLIELLVVVTIIGILASILVVAVYRAVVYAGAAARKAEVAKLSQQIDASVIAEGQGRMYPPNFSDQARVRTYLLKRFPRISLVDMNKVSALQLTPAQALVFWLMKVSADAENPFSGPGGPFSTTPSGEYDFDVSQLRNDPSLATSSPNIAYKVYTPKGSGVPFVYLAARPGQAANQVYIDSYNLTAVPDATSGVLPAGYAVPYVRDNNQGYCNPQSFQIISAGVDNLYGSTAIVTARNYPSGTGWTKDDDDNIVNFGEMPTIGGDKPQ